MYFFIELTFTVFYEVNYILTYFFIYLQLNLGFLKIY